MRRDSSASLHLKRVYAPPEDGDGLRVLIDRLWPRRLTKEKAKVDLWLKDIAPSHELRRPSRPAGGVRPVRSSRSSPERS
jgi:uncharacterized protein YeaO (DUF488 family)